MKREIDGALPVLIPDCWYGHGPSPARLNGRGYVSGARGEPLHGVLVRELPYTGDIETGRGQRGRLRLEKSLPPCAGVPTDRQRTTKVCPTASRPIGSGLVDEWSTPVRITSPEARCDHSWPFRAALLLPQVLASPIRAIIVGDGRGNIRASTENRWPSVRVTGHGDPAGEYPPGRTASSIQGWHGRVDAVGVGSSAGGVHCSDCR